MKNIRINYIAVDIDEGKFNLLRRGLHQHGPMPGIVAKLAAFYRREDNIPRSSPQAVNEIQHPINLQPLVVVVVPGQNHICAPFFERPAHMRGRSMQT